MSTNGDEIGEIHIRSASVMIKPRPQGEYSRGQNSQNLQLLPENTSVSRPQQIEPSVVSHQQQQNLQQLPLSVTQQIPVMSSHVNTNPSVSVSCRSANMTSANVSMTTNNNNNLSTRNMISIFGPPRAIEILAARTQCRRRCRTITVVWGSYVLSLSRVVPVVGMQQVHRQQQGRTFRCRTITAVWDSYRLSLSRGVPVSWQVHRQGRTFNIRCRAGICTR